MLRRKKIREKGKIRFSEYFKELKNGEKVSVVRELSIPRGRGFSKSIQGRTGIIEGKKGKCYIVNIKIGREKRFIIHPIHLKKLKS